MTQCQWSKIPDKIENHIASSM